MLHLLLAAKILMPGDPGAPVCNPAAWAAHGFYFAHKLGLPHDEPLYVMPTKPSEGDNSGLILARTRAGEVPVAAAWVLRGGAWDHTIYMRWDLLQFGSCPAIRSTLLHELCHVALHIRQPKGISNARYRLNEDEADACRLQLLGPTETAKGEAELGEVARKILDGDFQPANWAEVQKKRQFWPWP